MFQDPTEQQEKNPLIETSLQILNFRLSTIDPDNNDIKIHGYERKIRQKIRILETKTPEEILHRSLGILNEALFYTACQENLPFDIRISNAQEDLDGIDFILESEKRKGIDVTASKEQYPEKISTKTTIILSNMHYIDDILINNKGVDTKEYLLDVFNTNMEILNNRYSEYLIQKQVKKKGKKYFVTPVFSKYKNIAIHTKEHSRRTSKIFLTEEQYNKTIDVISMLKNFTI